MEVESNRDGLGLRSRGDYLDRAGPRDQPRDDGSGRVHQRHHRRGDRDGGDGHLHDDGRLDQLSGRGERPVLDLEVARVLARKETTLTATASGDLVPGASLRAVYVSGIEAAPSEPVARTAPFVPETRYSGVPERRFIESAMTSADAARLGNASLTGRVFIFAFPPQRPLHGNPFARMWALGQEDLLRLLTRTAWPGCLKSVDGIR